MLSSAAEAAAEVVVSKRAERATLWGEESYIGVLRRSDGGEGREGGVARPAHSHFPHSFTRASTSTGVVHRAYASEPPRSVSKAAAPPTSPIVAAKPVAMPA